ncbi:MAG: hypothetical protein ACTH4Y_11550 [Microbacterium gubbeenense]|uniref:hypothetical protein n=1 Tax=Microbacterium gubbeenense TaxID=159896 RepID=UPI003F9C5AF8
MTKKLKTIEQIADEVLSGTIARDGKAAVLNTDLVYRWVERAVEIDRFQITERDMEHQDHMNKQFDRMREWAAA